MRGVLDIRVEATGGAEDSGYHSGVHGGAVEEPMQVCFGASARAPHKCSVSTCFYLLGFACSHKKRDTALYADAELGAIIEPDV